MKIHGVIKINGTDYALRYGTNVLQKMEDVDGLYLDKLGEELSIGVVSKIFYHGIHTLHPKLTKEDVGDLMDDYFEEGGSLQLLAEAMVNAINKSLGVKTQRNGVNTEGLQESENIPK